MPKIGEIINDRPAGEIIGDLRQKTISVPAWGELEKEYDPKKHPVYTDRNYTDKPRKKGRIEKMSRITYAVQKQSVKRMKELMFTIPVRRVYTNHKREDEKQAAAIMEAIFVKNHIDSMNLKRAHKLFASCEIVTIWFAQMQDTVYAGEKSRLKLRCRTYSPMDGDELYPLFDEYDDMIALSIAYSRYDGQDKINYFDTYTAEAHYRWRQTAGSGADWEEDTPPEPINIAKIQGNYMYRPEPIWEDQSDNGYELEWTLSRNGNYLRKNSRPTWVEYTDKPKVKHGNEPVDDNAGRNILRYGKDDKAGYATWDQAVESLKFQSEELRRNIHTTLQLPDMSMEQMKATPMSGEARKMLFIDCQMKVTDESGDWIEFFDREVNVVRAYCKIMFPKLADAFDRLVVENVITPYQINSLSDDIKDGVNATNGKAVASRRTIVRRIGLVPEEELDEEIERIQQEEQQANNLFANEPTE